MDKEKLNPDQIKRAVMDLRDQIPKEEHEIAGIKVWIHGLTSYELEGWRLVRNNPDEGLVRLSTAKLLQLSMRDETGVRVFQDNELAIIGGLPAIELEPLSRAAMRLSGYGVEAQGEILKNLLQTPGGNGSLEQPESTNAASPNSVNDTQDGK